jgi:hypothetical protein
MVLNVFARNNCAAPLACNKIVQVLSFQPHHVIMKLACPGINFYRFRSRSTSSLIYSFGTRIFSELTVETPFHASH